VILAPLHHPLRLAEDAATVSLISGGRFTLGIGLGWSEVEFAGLGADLTKRGAAMREIVTILRQAWSGEPFLHEGQVYRFPELAVRPRPSAPIPILIGGSAEPAIRRAARVADGIFSNASPRRFLQQLEWIRDECEKVHRDPSELRIIHYSVMLPGASHDEAWERYRDAIWHMDWKYDDMEASANRPGPPPAPPPMSDDHRAALARRFILAGPAEEIISTLLDLREQAGLPVEFAARSHFTMLDHDAQLELMAQLAEEVAPHL
jgi:alkanesulfonate monooxygenase SsuD/methylene tetrahydromethanopterin reductase-like flavin-dependent oxidoreductase (luciferase family)